ncbi:hypothetical protein CCACVL1_00766, partial [Corchorus capsularis]
RGSFAEEGSYGDDQWKRKMLKSRRKTRDRGPWEKQYEG